MEDYKEYCPITGKVTCAGTKLGGMLDGQMTWFYPEGTPHMVANYKCDMLDGDYVRYREDGTIAATKVYKMGEIIKAVTMWPNSEIIRSKTVTNCDLTKSKFYNENGGLVNVIYTYI
jgi:antitoxin component YwqK of YwqJK toxin-antitoxin module